MVAYRFEREGIALDDIFAQDIPDGVSAVIFGLVLIEADVFFVE